MTRTKRIYNLRLKAPRYNVDDKEPHIIHGIPYTIRSWICMGRCPKCRDSKLEQKKLRKQRKEALRLELNIEKVIKNGTI